MSRPADSPFTLQLTLETKPSAVRALAQFIKRTRWEHFMECAIDRKEAELIREGVEQLSEALANKGYAPR